VDTCPLSAAAFRRLVDEVALELAAAGVSAQLASTAGSLRSAGPTWISMASARGYGRLIRRADGSFESLAYRIPGGEPLWAEVGECVRRAHLVDLIAALSQTHRTG
jgi:hypothetical protein